MRLKLSLVFLLVLICLIETKRTRGRSGAVSLWSRKRKGSTGLHVRRSKARPAESKVPVIKSNVDNNSNLNRKTQQSTKLRQKRYVNSSPDYPEFNPYDGLQKFSGSFGKHVASRPYKVYTFNNQPKEERPEVILPGNILTCNENATEVCIAGTTAICTRENKILCIAAMTSTFPCQDNNKEMCVRCTIPCVHLCPNDTKVSLTCFAILTLESDSSVINVTLPKSEDNKFCVILMAVPEPDLAVGEVKITATEDNIYTVINH